MMMNSVESFDAQMTSIAEHHADRVADHGAEHRLDQDDLVDVAGRGAERAQGGELVQVVLGARVERLGDDDDADDHAEGRAGDQSRAGAGLEQPVVDAAVAELLLRQHLAILQAGDEIGPHLFEVGVRGRRAPAHTRPDWLPASMSMRASFSEVNT